MSVEARQGFSRSWLSVDFARSRGAELADQLRERCKGEDGVFVSVTYDRDDWESPHELYRAASEERHARLFIRAVGRILGQNLTGRWLCKMEFQRGGWLHFHFVILGVKHIPHDRLTAAWGMGFVWVNRITRKRTDYLCKYVSKDGAMPTFLYGEKSRSVKVIRTSPGFWQRPPKPRPERRHFQQIAAYRTVGEGLEQARKRVILRSGSAVKSVKTNLGVWAIVAAGLAVVGAGQHSGWVRLQSSLTVDQVAVAISAASEASGVHSIPSQDPHSSGWVAEWFRHRAEESES